MKFLPLIFIIIFAVIIAVWHNFIPSGHMFIHDLYPLLYQFPVVLAGLYYGRKGGIGIALLVTGLSIPHIMYVLKIEPLEIYKSVTEIVIYYVVGFAVGYSSDGLRSEQLEKAEMLNEFRISEKMSALGELTYVITHELKTPIASLSGAVELLRDRSITPGQCGEYLDIIEKELKRMNDLVNRTLSIFREKRVKKIRVNINTFLKEIVMIASVMSKGRPEIQVRIETKREKVLIAPDLLKEALLNLIDNALEAAGGPVRIDITLLDSDKGLELNLRDYGPGMDESVRKRIFTPFFTTRPNGTGLGLAIAKRIVELHGGTIFYANPPHGKGCEFVLTLPDKEME